MKQFQKVSLRIIAGIGAMIFLGLTYYTWRYTMVMATRDEALRFVRDNMGHWALILCALLLVTGAVGLAARILPERVLHVIAAGVSVAVVIGTYYLVIGAHAVPVADQGEVFKAAVELAQGRFYEMQPGQYFSVYPHQLGLVKLYSLIFGVSGDYSPETVQLVHAVCAGISVYAGFRITRELFHNVWTELMYLLCILCFLPLYIYTLFIYGETFGVCGTLLSIWFYLAANREGIKRPAQVVCYLLTGAALLLACVARSALIIVWIAMVILQVLVFLKRRKVFPLIMTVLVLILPFGGQQLLRSSVEKQAGLEFDNGMPVRLWLAMGIQNDIRPGSYNGYSINLFRKTGFDQEESSEQAGQAIADRLKSWAGKPQEWIPFFREKIVNQWNEPSYASFTMTQFLAEPEEWVEELFTGELHDQVYWFMNAYQAMAYFFMLVYFLALFAGRPGTQAVLPGLVVIGGFLFSIIWEAKSRYIYPYLVVAAPCVAYGLTLCCGGAGRLLRQCGTRFLGWKHSRDKASLSASADTK